jgi:hypothetical protein
VLGRWRDGTSRQAGLVDCQLRHHAYPQCQAKEQFKMRQLRILGLALMTVFALGVAISATASAEELGILPEGTAAEPLTVDGTAGKGVLETLGKSKVECASAELLTTWTSHTLGLFHLHFKGCKSSGVGCSTAGDAKEVILALGTVHLVFDKITEGLGAGVLLLLEEVHMTCGELIKVLILVRGSILCLATPINTLIKEGEVICKQTGGDQAERSYWTSETGTEEKATLETSINGGAFEISGDESKETKLKTFEKGGKKVETILVHA